jgi:glycosyltransferase involved in cell wall biosynthesis
MKVLILWTHWSGYMDACASKLQWLLSCDLDIIYFDNLDVNAPFAAKEFFEYPCTHGALSAERLSRLRRETYDLILICGWHVKQYVAFVKASRGRSINVLCFDRPWIASARQYLGVIWFRTCLRRYFDFAFIPGCRQARFAGKFGFGPHEIVEGHYSCADSFAPISEVEFHRSFLFVGRLVPEKGVQELARAWETYVGRNTQPWSLKICGTGPYFDLFKDLPRVQLLGFVQPSLLPQIMMQASALILPSLREPWGVVIHEAARCGLGLVVTSACGASDYFLRDGVNGRLIQAGDANALCGGLEWFHELDDRTLKGVRERSTFLGAQRTPLTWASSVSRALVIGHRRS